MRQDEPARTKTYQPCEWRDFVPFQPAAASERLGWSSIEASCYHVCSNEIDVPPLTHHTLVMITRPPDELDVRFDDVTRHTPPASGWLAFVPAGNTVHWRWRGPKDSLHVYLEPGLLERVAGEAFDLDPAKVTIPSLEAMDVPQLRAAMQAVHTELCLGGAGGRLAAEALANVLAVNLIRHISAPRETASNRCGKLPACRLRAVANFVDDHLDDDLTLDQMAAVVHLSPYHFARQFKAATGLPPHQYVIARRVERAKGLLGDQDLSLVQVAARAGFADQSHFCRHFKRVVGVTPGQFRAPARTG